MISILRILVFILVQGHVVCDRELYPVSMFRMDIDENQPIDLPENGKTKPPRGKSDGERRAVAPAVNEITPENLRDGIANAYGFEKDPNDYRWKTLPSFEGKIGKPGWADAAQLAEDFFRANNGHNTPWKNLLNTKSELDLLYITAARYLFVTHVLWVQSNRQLIACKEKRDKYSGIIQSFEIPATGVCFPLPYGSATYKSDYDVGLIGVNSGTLTQSFNQYFQAAAPDGFGKPSELVFDTNVYAFTLEFAMPAMFLKLPETFAAKVAKLETKVKYKMQELASAYYKVYKYNIKFFETMVNAAKLSMKGAPKSKAFLEKWLETFKSLDAKIPMRPGVGVTESGLRLAHNNQYQALVKEMTSKGGYKPALLDVLAKALIYAAEAYHTRGAIRHVVGGTQMKVIDISTSLSLMDLWVSMIENWGESNKEFGHCQMEPLEVCFLKMSKYMWRMFNAMNLIRTKIKPENRLGLVHFGEGMSDPEYAMRMWLDYKRQGKTAIPKQQDKVIQFLRQFKCDKAQIGQPISSTCIAKMNDKVNAYNERLAAQWTDAPVPPPWRY